MSIEGIATSAQLACILEASAPKPGNVNRYHDFEDTKFEHFLASGLAIGRPAEEAAQRGYKAGAGGLRISEIGMGDLIKEAVIQGRRWHRGGNTNLGVAMLLLPLSAAWGMAVAKGREEEGLIRSNIDDIIKGSTYKDTLSLYKAIRLARPGGLGRVRHLDVCNGASDREIEEKEINLFQIMEATEGDSIARELTTGFEISFKKGYPAIARVYSREGDISKAIVHGYLVILSEVPDSLIARKKGINAAREVSERAQKVLEGKLDIREFDESLRDKENSLNPGTTADLIASSTMIALLRGLRP